MSRVRDGRSRATQARAEAGGLKRPFAASAVMIYTAFTEISADLVLVSEETARALSRAYVPR